MSREIMQQALSALMAISKSSRTQEDFQIAASAATGLRDELAKPEPIYVMGNYAGEGKVVSASFGLPKGAFEFAPYTGAGEASKIKHSIEPEQEPVAWMLDFIDDGFEVKDHVVTKPEYIGAGYNVRPLYTAPPRKEWVGLTDDEFKFIASKYSLNTGVGLGYFHEEIEAKLKELNT
jgi:hypothetical protein